MKNLSRFAQPNLIEERTTTFFLDGSGGTLYELFMLRKLFVVVEKSRAAQQRWIEMSEMIDEANAEKQLAEEKLQQTERIIRELELATSRIESSLSVIIYCARVCHLKSGQNRRNLT